MLVYQRASLYGTLVGKYIVSPIKSYEIRSKYSTELRRNFMCAMVKSCCYWG